MPTSVLALVSDLFFVVKIGDAAKRAGLTVQFTSDPTLALAKAREIPSLILIDLNNDRAAPINFIQDLKAAPETRNIPLIAYVSHVQIELKQKAMEAGCDRVLARSALSDQLTQLLQLAQGRAAID